MFGCLFALFVVGCACGGISEASIITSPCSLKDESCLIKSGTATLKTLLNGNAEVKTPNLTPLVLPFLKLDGNQLSATFKDLHIYGLEDGEITSAKFDTDAHTGEVTLHVPNAQLIGDYTLTGKISILTLDGKGRANVTAVNGNFVWTFSYDLLEKNGQTHLKIGQHHNVHKVERAYFDFENVIPGNELLSKSTNHVLNEEWEAVLNDLGVGITEAIGSTFYLITNNIFNKYPLSVVTKP